MWQQVEQSLHSSMGLVMNKIATLLPGILAFIAAFLFFLLIGWLVALLVRRILTAMHFDERMRGGASAIAEWSPRATPSLLVGRVVFWCFVFAGVVVGVSALGTSEHIVSGWMLGYVPRLVGAAILLLAGNVLARFVARSVLITGVNLNLSYARLLSMGVRSAEPSSSWGSAFSSAALSSRLRWRLGLDHGTWSAARSNAKPRARSKSRSRRKYTTSSGSL